MILKYTQLIQCVENGTLQMKIGFKIYSRLTH